MDIRSHLSQVNCLSLNAFLILRTILIRSNNPSLVGVKGRGNETKILIPGSLIDEKLFNLVERDLWAGAGAIDSAAFVSGLEEVMKLSFITRTPRCVRDNGKTCILSTYGVRRTKHLNRLELEFMTREELVRHICK